MTHGVHDQLETDPDKNERKTVAEVDQAIEQSTKQEVQLSESEKCPGVSHEHQVRLLSNTVNGRDGIEREQQVGATDGDHHQHHWCDPLASIDINNQPVFNIVIGNREDASHKANECVFGIRFLLAFRQLHAGEDKEDTENVKDPAELVDERSTRQDEEESQDQRNRDTYQQDFLLIDSWNGESGHDDEKDKQVIDTQRLLGQVAGEVLQTVLRIPHHPYTDAEDERANDIDG